MILPFLKRSVDVSLNVGGIYLTVHLDKIEGTASEKRPQLRCSGPREMINS